MYFCWLTVAFQFIFIEKNTVFLVVINLHSAFYKLLINRYKYNLFKLRNKEYPTRHENYFPQIENKYNPRILCDMSRNNRPK